MCKNMIMCNPLNLEYRYQLREFMGKVTLSREAADPTCILFGDKYLLFCSMSGGFWYSDDLVEWKFHETPELPIYDYAPDVRIIDNRVVFSASKRKKCSFYVSEDPLNQPFAALEEQFPWWDPNIFQDDDGRVYFYWGCSTKPIWGVEVDRKTLKPIGEKVQMIAGHPEQCGWERAGENNIVAKPKNYFDFVVRLINGSGPFIEGAYMTKYHGKYYFQYACPGTEFNIYGDGVYVADHPLGPFTMQIHNPFSAVPGGFINGAGHGSTFQDKQGKWWHISTMRISVNENFERRIGLFPCDFDKDGILHCNQELADYPFNVETRERTGWMLLDGEMKASSLQNLHEPQKACDENIRTWWAPKKSDRAPWLMFDLKQIKTIHAIQLNFADFQTIIQQNDKEYMVGGVEGKRKIYVHPQQTKYLLEGSVDGEVWECIKNASNSDRDYSHDFVLLDQPVKFRYIKVSKMQVPFDGSTAISGLRVFGKGNEELPEKVSNVTIQKSGDLNYILQWSPAKYATRYNVRYGIAPDKLYGSWQCDTNKLDFSFVKIGETYYFAVDSINENGITEGTVNYSFCSVELFTGR